MGVCDYFVVKSDNHLTHNCQYTYVTHTVTNPSRICILVRPSTKIPEAQLIPHFPRAKHHIINLETDKEELEATPLAPVLGKPVEDDPDKEPDEKEAESEEDEEENSETRSLTAASGGAHTSSAWAGRTVTLQMLLSTGILKPEKASMAIEYMGQKFVGDLLPDGKIKSLETETVFCSPSAWAINCKRIINPEKKSGCGWSSVKYKGKKLDHYKQMYLRKMQSQKECSPSDEEPDVLRDVKEISPPPPIKRHILTHNTINNRHITHDANSLLEAVTFATLGKLQPFHMTVSTSALLLMDLHSHLTKTEVSGYLGGTWETNTHNLTITHAFPCRNGQWDREKAAEMELAIKKAMTKQNLTLVGWYHSHPRSPAQPTLRDIDAQLDYQIKMRGSSDNTYSPCVGMICSPYYQQVEEGRADSINSLESALIAYWVIPPSENKPHEYGRPMLMTYAVRQDKELSTEVVDELQMTMHYYRELDCRRMMVKFEEKFRGEVTYVEKFRTSLYPKFVKKGDPLDLWNLILEGLGMPPDERFEVPNVEHSAIMALIRKEEQASVVTCSAVKEEGVKCESTVVAHSVSTPLSQISSLQEQLNMPSGLNMNPILFSQTEGQQPDRETNNNSPITIPSNSASPAATVRFEVPPVRMSPSPAKSDTASTASSSRLMRNSPAPSPGRGGSKDDFRGSPSIANIPGLTITPSSMGGSFAKGGSGPSNELTLEKIESMMRDGAEAGLKSTSTVNYEGGSAAAAAQNMNELFSASLATLSKSLPPGLLAGVGGGTSSAMDYQSLFGVAGTAPDGSLSRGDRDRERPSSNKSGSSSSGGGNPRGQETKEARPPTATTTAAALSKEKFTIEQLMHSPVVPPHLKELLSQIDQNDLNFILSHPMFNNPEFLNALMPKGGQSQVQANDRGQGTPIAGESPSSRSSSRGGGGTNTGGSSRTSGSGKQSSNNSYGGGLSGSGSGAASNKEPKGYYDTHQLPSSLANTTLAAQQQQQQQQQQQPPPQKGSKSSSSSASAASAAQNLMMMGQYEEANKHLAELMKSPEYAMLLQQNAAAAAAYGMAFDPAALLGGHFTGPVPQPPQQQQQQQQESGGGSFKKGNNSKGKQQNQAAAQQKQQQAAAAAAMQAMGLPPMPSLAELNSLLQATQKMPELSSLFGAKPSEINALIQQQMAQQMRHSSEQSGAGSGGSGRSGRGRGGSEGGRENSRKPSQQALQQQQQQQQQQDINALFGSKLPDLTTITPISSGGSNSSTAMAAAAANANAMAAMSGLPPEFASIFAAGGGGLGKKGDPMPNNDMLATLLQIGKSSDLSQLLFPLGSGGQPPTAKQLADLNAFFSHPPPGLGIGKGGGVDGGAGVSAHDAMSLYPNISVQALQSDGGRAGGSSSSSSGSSSASSKKQQQQQQQQAAAVQQQQQQQMLQFQQEQQELAILYQQHMKYPGIPDPLSKSTLAANNLYMTPSAALMKMQQEALNSIMMKPPKAASGGGNSTSSSSSAQQSLVASHLMGAAAAAAAGMTPVGAMPPLSHSPLSERLLATTPTKSNSSASSSRGNSPHVMSGGGGGTALPKSYGFSVADLAISSVGTGRTMTPSPKSTTSSNYGGSASAADLSRKSMSPANLSAFGDSGSLAASPIKKRMEFSSIADLAAPPPAKVPKFDDVTGLRMPSVSPALSSTGSLTGRPEDSRDEMTGEMGR